MDNIPIGYNNEGDYVGLLDRRASDFMTSLGITEEEELVTENLRVRCECEEDEENEEEEKGLQATDIVFNLKNLN